MSCCRLRAARVAATRAEVSNCAASFTDIPVPLPDMCRAYRFEIHRVQQRASGTESASRDDHDFLAEPAVRAADTDEKPRVRGRRHCGARTGYRRVNGGVLSRARRDADAAAIPRAEPPGAVSRGSAGVRTRTGADGPGALRAERTVGS